MPDHLLLVTPIFWLVQATRYRDALQEDCKATVAKGVDNSLASQAVLKAWLLAHTSLCTRCGILAAAHIRRRPI